MENEIGSPLTPFLEDGDVIILDGALATELERRGQICAMRYGQPSCCWKTLR